MSKTHFPIGALDSGIGGLTVVKEIFAQLPAENMLYFADLKRMPYGTKSSEEIKRYVTEIAEFLLTKNIKILIIACNTATAAALKHLKKILPIPVIGVIIPGVRAALKATKNKKIGVIGSTGTIKSGAHEKALKQINTELEVINQACPGLAEMIERGQIHTDKTEITIRKYLRPLKQQGIDTLLLGCTHFQFISNSIKKIMGEDITLVNPVQKTVKAVEIALSNSNLMVDSYKSPGERLHKIFVSEYSENFNFTVNQLFQQEIEIKVLENYPRI